MRKKVQTVHPEHKTYLPAVGASSWSFLRVSVQAGLVFRSSVDPFLAEVTYRRSSPGNREPKFQHETCIKISVAPRYSRRSSFLSKLQCEVLLLRCLSARLLLEP